MARLLSLTLLITALLAPAAAWSAPSRPQWPRASTHTALVHPSARPAAVAAPTAVGTRNPVTAAISVAQRYWHAVPCAGRVKVVANVPLAAGVDPSTDGWVTFATPLGADNLDAPPATYTDCTISLAHWQWATWTDMERDWDMFCLTVTHEMGHLLGHKHSLTPGSVMAAVFTSHANVPAGCRASWLPGWRPRVR